VDVVTTDTAGPGRGDNLVLAANPAVFSDALRVTYCHRVAGVSVAPRLVREIRARIASADLVHLTSVYTFATFPALLLSLLEGKPLVWSPRGSLQRWQGSRRRAAKWLWERACDALLSPERCLVHATTDSERAETSRRLRNARFAVVPNGVDMPPAGAIAGRAWRPGGTLRALFMGRLDPKKGLENLLHAIAKDPALRVSLTVCGDGPPPYAESLRRLSNELGVSERVVFAGHVEGDAKLRAFHDADVCVVPSYTENFGMVVAESLAHGVPVIASRGTPWAGIASRGCGYWSDNAPHALGEALRAISREDPAAMGARGRAWMAAEFDWDRVAASMLRVYRDLLERPADGTHRAGQAGLPPESGA